MTSAKFDRSLHESYECAPSLTSSGDLSPASQNIADVLKREEGGMKVAEICRQEGISEQTFYRWKSLYGGMASQEVRRLKDLEEENRRLKQLVGEQALDI